MKRNLLTGLLATATLCATLVAPAQAMQLETSSQVEPISTSSVFTASNLEFNSLYAPQSVNEIEAEILDLVSAVYEFDNGEQVEITPDVSVSLIGMTRSSAVYEATVTAVMKEVPNSGTGTNYATVGLAGDIKLIWQDNFGWDNELISITGGWTKNASAVFDTKTLRVQRYSSSGTSNSDVTNTVGGDRFFHTPTTLGIAPMMFKTNATSFAKATRNGVTGQLTLTVSTVFS